MRRKTLLSASLLSVLLFATASLAQESAVKAYLESAEKTADETKKAELLRAARKEAGSLNNPGLLSRSLLASGKFELLRGDQGAAKKYFDQAVEVSQNPSGKALANSLVGNAYRAADLLPSALPYYKAAVAIREKHDPPGSPSAPIFAQVLKDLANCERDLGNLAVAESLYGQAIAIVKDRPNDNYHLAAAWEGLAELRLAEGNPKEAVTLARQALEIFEQQDNHLGKGNCLATIAKAKEKQGESEAALAVYKQAIAAFDSKGVSDLPALVPLLENAARLLKASGDHEEAKQLTARADQVRAKKTSRAASLP